MAMASKTRLVVVLVVIFFTGHNFLLSMTAAKTVFSYCRLSRNKKFSGTTVSLLVKPEKEIPDQNTYRGPW
jgi:hypothetical protein